MGNRLCKSKKLDTVDSSGGGINKGKSQSKFDRIFSRFNLKPTTWKSESHLTNQSKQVVKRNDPSTPQEKIKKTQNLSKSSDWTDATLEVPEEKIHLKNPKLTLIFDNSEKSTPTPPPRKHHKKNFREKIESVARNGFQALQADKKHKNDDLKKGEPIIVEEPMCVKKKINYKCPICDSDEVNHNRDHHHHGLNRNNKNDKREADLEDITSLIIPEGDIRLEDPTKTKKVKKTDSKNGSVTSLPNYNDLKLSVAKSDISDGKNSSKSGSRLSLQSNQSKKSNSAKLDALKGRVRSFGSLIPQKLNRVKPQKVQKEQKIEHHIESDDSFGPLEDWDLGLIEHYNPKEASLPRPPKKPQKPSKEVLSNIGGLVVQEEEIIPAQTLRNSAPVPKKEVAVYKNFPQVTKIVEKSNATKVQVPKAVPEDVCLTPPPSPKNSTLKNHLKMENIPLNSSQTQEIGHSNLLRILKELSPKLESNKEQIQDSGSNMSSLTPSLVEFEKNLSVVAVENFINAEKVHTEKSIGNFL